MGNDKHSIGIDLNGRETVGSGVLALAEHAESIRRLGRKLVTDVIEIGRRLSECKRVVGHGNWLSWIQREFGWSERTSRNFMSVYEMSLSESANFADLKIELGTLYLLASPSTPDQTRDDVLRRLREGEDLAYAEVKGIVSEAREDRVVPTRTEPVTTMRFIRHQYRDFIALSDTARAKILEERPQNFDLAVQDALTRQRWPAPYRELHDVLDAIETLKNRSSKKIVGMIPAAHLDGVKQRVNLATGFLAQIDRRLKDRRK